MIESLSSAFSQLTSNRLVGILIESFPKMLLPGLKMTIPLTAISFACALVIALIAALIRVAKVPVLQQLVRFYIWVIRGTPLLVQLYVVFFGLPNLGIVLEPFPTAVLVFSINEGAYCAETIRAAIESIPCGQMEAGNNLYQRAMLMFNSAGFAPNIRMSLSQLVTAYHFSAQGIGCTFVSDFLVRHSDENLFFFNLGMPEAQRVFHVLLPNRSYTPASVRAFIQLAEKMHWGKA